MLAVEPMDPGRTWDLLSANSSMMGNAKAWLPSASPAFLAERQAVSPASQSHPATRGPLGRRRPVQPPRRRHGGGGGGGARGGGWRASGSAGTVETSASEGPTAGRGPSDNNSAGSSSHPRSQGQYSHDEEGRLARAQGARGGGSGGGVGTRGRGGGGEAWGLSAVASARCSDRMHGSGVGSSRGSKSSSASDVWAWSGAGGGAARGKAMLSAYGLQTGKHNPTCPRGGPGDGSARLGRWHCGQGGSAEQGAGGGKADAEEVHEKCGGAGGGGNGYCRSSVCGEDERCGGNRPDRAACGHGQRFRSSKGRKHRPSVALSKPHAAARSSGDQSSGTPSGGRGRGVWDAPEDASDGKRGETLPHAAADASRDEDVSVATITPTAPTPSFAETPASREHTEGDNRPADHIRRTLEDLLVPPRGSASHGSSASTLAPHQGGCRAPAAAAADHGQVTVLTMDGRGGSAAPPHRPSQLAVRAPASAFYSPVLPDLAGVETGAGAMPCEAGGSCGQASGEGGSVGGGDDHSTPPVSRQRAHSHHSPWQARKHPRGFMGGRGGAGFGRCHHYHQERSLVGGKRNLGLAEKTNACLSPSSSEPGAAQITDGTPVTKAAAGLEDVVSLCAAPPIALARSPAEFAGDGNAYSDRQTSSGEYYSAAVTSTTKSNRAAGVKSPDAAALIATVEWPASTRGALLGERGAAAGREEGGLDPFDRLMDDTIAISSQSQLIDHFKLAPRPTSRRGSRNQGGEGDAVKPAFCLFSGHRDDRASGPRAAAESRSKSREDGRRGKGKL